MHIVRDTWAYLCWLWVLGLKPTKARLKNEIIQSVTRLSFIRSRRQTWVGNVLTEELVGRGKMISQVLDKVTCAVLSLYFINLWITSRLWGPAQVLLEMKSNNGTMSYIKGGRGSRDVGLEINISPSWELLEFYLWSTWELFFLQGETSGGFSFLSIMQCHTKK